MRRRNPEPPRCAWCDMPFADAASLIAHHNEHRRAEREQAEQAERDAGKEAA